ncbi:MAG: aminotransferase class I/II-fold pyridoxal phosphate-dependent enzyme [Pseudomonadota bacterium]
MMQYPARYAELPEYAFPRLRRLLAPHAPGGPEIAMSLGEPQHQVPDFVGEIMLEHTAKLSKYPPNEGLPELRAAISDWLSRRYGVADRYRDPETQIFPLNGTREGLYHACIALSPEVKNGKRPAVLLPNPFYQCYTVAAVTSGAEPVYLPCGPETGFLPEFASLPKDLLDRTTVAYICSPANPQGVCADRDYWKTLLDLAEAHDFRVFADECYSEIYRSNPPVGALEVASEIGADPERLVAFHSLSKRSNLAGLRSGFGVTGPENRKRMLQMRSYVGAPLPIPAQHAAAACWQDEAHVVENRALYKRKYAIADEVLGNMPGYAAPDAGFFLWLDVGDGEAAAMKLWEASGVKALPGSYLSRPVDPALGGGDPGTQYLRLAMVAPAEDVRRGLEAVRAVLMET